MYLCIGKRQKGDIIRKSAECDIAASDTERTRVKKPRKKRFIRFL